MNTTYEWLYDNYAEPQLNEIFANEEKTLKELIEKMNLSTEERIRLSDTVSALRLRWGAEVFAMGIQLGARLAVPQGVSQSL